MATHDNSPSRRAVLGALATTPLIGGFGAAIAGINPAEAATVDGSKWYALKAEWERIEGIASAFDRDYYNPAYDAWTADIARIPHHVARYSDESGLPQYAGELTTAKPDNMRAARGMVDRFGDRGANTNFLQACRELVEADERRQTKMKRLDRHHRVTEYGTRADELGELRYEAEWAVMNEPAPDLPALLWKVEKLLALDPDGGTAPWSEEAVRQTMADARRLLGEA